MFETRFLHTVFTRFVPHPRIVPHYLKGFILASRNDFNCTASSNSTAPFFCKHLLLVPPYLKYSYPSQCKQEIVLVSLDGHKMIEILDIIQ